MPMAQQRKLQSGAGILRSASRAQIRINVLFNHFNDGQLKNITRGGQLRRRQTGFRDRGSHLPIRSEVVWLVHSTVVV
jgi:hypothetical protein